MDVAQWQRRLEQNFTVNGVVGGHLLEVHRLEKACGQFFAHKYHGQSVLLDSFQSFYIETVHLAYARIAGNGWPNNCESYAPILLFYVINFKSFRACENMLTRGYALDGYARLRDLKDRAVFLGGIANNITTFPKIFGYSDEDAVTGKEWNTLRNKRRKEERKVLGRMLREKSGLPGQILSQLGKWEHLFHQEVHGSRLTYFRELDQWIQTKKPPSVGPVANEESMAVYMNRAAEIGWMFVRLFPFLQLTKNAFGDEWKERQKILDDSFRVMEQGLSELGKRIADAFVCLMDEKFAFPEDFHYFEADGTA